MRDLFGKLESPAITNLSVTFSDAKADITPATIPDIYRGEPLLLAARLDRLQGSVEIKGKVGDRLWTVKIPLAKAAEGKGVRNYGHGARSTDAEVALTMRNLQPDTANKTILALALEHQLVTRLTSLVAVDKTPTRPDGEPLKLSQLPINLPAGWDFQKLFGDRGRALPPSPPSNERRADAQPVQLAMAKRAAGPSSGAIAVTQPVTTVALPTTATDAELKMMLGAFLLALSFLLLVFNRRRPRTLTAC